MCWVIIRYVSWQAYGILVLVSASQTQISLCHNLLLGCQIILRFCTEHDNFGFGTLVLHINAENPVRLDFRNLYYLCFPDFMFENLELTCHLTSFHDEFIVAPSGWKPSGCRCRISLLGKHTNIARSFDLFPKYASSTHLKSKTTAYIHIYVWYKYLLKQNCHIFRLIRCEEHVVWQPALSLCAIPFNGIPPLVSCIPRSANQFNAQNTMSPKRLFR